nr:hypothetical protein BN444_03364 [Xanthomonas translucens pv. translucens DSM 18974]
MAHAIPCMQLRFAAQIDQARTREATVLRSATRVPVLNSSGGKRAAALAYADAGNAS